MLIIEIEKRHNKMVDRIRYPTVSYLPFYYVFFQFLLLTIFNLQANILTTKDILSNLAAIEDSISFPFQKFWPGTRLLRPSTRCSRTGVRGSNISWTRISSPSASWRRQPSLRRVKLINPLWPEFFSRNFRDIVLDRLLSSTDS